MMGIGKSTLGRKLADHLDREFRDSDKILVHRLGRPVPQLFRILGEDAFRDHESKVLEGMEPGPYVLSTGGGVVLRDRNWEAMRKAGLIIFLSAPMDVLLRRLAESRKPRPLLQVEDPESRIREIYEARYPLYCKADLTVDLGDNDSDGALQRVVQALEQLP